jgi:hypothetical protein
MARNRIQHSRRSVKIGRPTAYSLELAQQIAYLVGLGLTQLEAASANDLPFKTLETWLKVHPELNDMVAKAQAIAIKTQLEKLTNSNDTRDTQFWLERTQGPRFARPDIANVINMQLNNLGEGASIHFNLETLEDAQKQLNVIQAIKESPGELNPRLPAPGG